jgi:CheY-like chemotaxis protein
MVEDNPGDVKLIQSALNKTDFVDSIAVATDGQEAVDYLTKKGGYADVDTPDMVLLDLNLPKQHGLDVLRQMRDTDSLRDLPVMVLTSSDNPNEMNEAYALAASLFMTKPAEVEGFEEFAESLGRYWRQFLVAA